MLIQSAIKVSLWLAIGFGLAACAVATEAPLPTARQDDSTTGTPMEDPGPAGVTVTAIVDNPQSSIAATAPKSQTPPPLAMTSIPAVSLPDLGLAPDFTNEVWLNSDRPLDLASLQGKVVLVEFWTFG